MNSVYIKNVVAATKKLIAMDPQDKAVGGCVDDLGQQISLLMNGKMPLVEPVPAMVPAPALVQVEVSEEMDSEDCNLFGEQINKLKCAAMDQADKYQRVASICAGIERAWAISERPQYSNLRPKLATIIKKTAGVFAEVDTVEDLDRPLSEIEKAVHSLYGDQSKNSTFYHERRGKGHHGEK